MRINIVHLVTQEVELACEETRLTVDSTFCPDKVTCEECKKRFHGDIFHKTKRFDKTVRNYGALLFGENLKMLLEMSNVQQKELAEKIGCGVTSVGDWARGVRWPSVEHMIAICEFFGMTPNQILGFDKPTKKMQTKMMYIERQITVQFQVKDGEPVIKFLT